MDRQTWQRCKRRDTQTWTRHGHGGDNQSQGHGETQGDRETDTCDHRPQINMNKDTPVHMDFDMDMGMQRGSSIICSTDLPWHVLTILNVAFTTQPWVVLLSPAVWGCAVFFFTSSLGVVDCTFSSSFSALLIHPPLPVCCCLLLCLVLFSLCFFVWCCLVSLRLVRFSLSIPGGVAFLPLPLGAAFPPPSLCGVAVNALFSFSFFGGGPFSILLLLWVVLLALRHLGRCCFSSSFGCCCLLPLCGRYFWPLVPSTFPSASFFTFEEKLLLSPLSITNDHCVTSLTLLKFTEVQVHFLSKPKTNCVCLPYLLKRSTVRRKFFFLPSRFPVVGRSSSFVPCGCQPFFSLLARSFFFCSVSFSCGAVGLRLCLCLSPSLCA